MNQKELKFEAPRYLNELREATQTNKQQWTHGSSSAPLVLELDTWEIGYEGTFAHITEWHVNQSNCTMILEAGTGYEEIDFPFCVAMLGQIVSREDFLKYFSELQEEFRVSPTPGGDAPTPSDKLNTNV